MTPRLRPFKFAPFLLAALAGGLGYAAENQPHIAYVYPAGARQGDKVVVLIGGQNLEGVTNIFITGGKVSAELKSFNRDLDPKSKAQLMRNKSTIEAKLAAAKPEEKASLEARLAQVMQRIAQLEPPPDDPEMMKYMMGMKQRRQINEQLTDLVRLDLTVGGDANVGRREIRLETPRGVSDPLSFIVGNMAEMQEQEPNDGTSQANACPALPAVLNGQILPGDLDRWRIKARKGQQLVFAVQARELMPYLADAVPGWFQAVLSVYNAAGNREVAYADHFRQYPDPVVAYTMPEDGELVLEIRDSIYRGREDFVYRVTVGAFPYITGIFPLGGPMKGKTTVELYGWNLPTPKAALETRSAEGGLIAINPLGTAGYNPLSFVVDELPELRSAADNHRPEKAQAVKLPVSIDGRIDKAGSGDFYRFSGKAGERISAEVWARRVGSPLDSTLRLIGPKGEVVATNDDFVDEMAGLVTHHADSCLELALPETGEYTVILRDAQGKGGSDYSYRLHLSPVRPDFRMRVTPSCASIPSGGTASLDLHVQRLGGFDGEIEIALANAVAGCTLEGAPIRSLEKVIPITLTIPTVDGEFFSPQLVASARIGGKAVRHTVIAAEDMMQAFAYRHLVSAQDLVLKIIPPRKVSLALEEQSGPLELRLGQETKLPVTLAGVKGASRAVAGRKKGGGDAAQSLEFELESPAKGVSVVNPKEKEEGAPAVAIIKVDGALAKAGECGNLVINAYYVNNPGKTAIGVKVPRVFLCTLPAVRYEIVK